MWKSQRNHTIITKKSLETGRDIVYNRIKMFTKRKFDCKTELGLERRKVKKVFAVSIAVLCAAVFGGTAYVNAEISRMPVFI